VEIASRITSIKPAGPEKVLLIGKIFSDYPHTAAERKTGGAQER